MWAVDTTLLMQAITAMMGFFFLSSGFHKAFFPEVNDKMKGMFTRLKVGWALPLVIGGEFLGGLALLMGFLVPVAAAGLLVILAGAICLVCWPEVVAKHPRDAFDWAAKAIYMPEGLMSALLVAIMLAGASVDHTAFWLPILFHPVTVALGMLVAVIGAVIFSLMTMTPEQARYLSRVAPDQPWIPLDLEKRKEAE